MAETTPGKRIFVYRNGEFSKRHYLVVKDVKRDFETYFERLMDECTTLTRSGKAVVRLTTPQHGRTTVTSFESLAKDGEYVAIPYNERFKHIPYGKTRANRPRREEIHRRGYPNVNSGRARKVYEEAKHRLRRIRVYTCIFGQLFSRTIVLNQRALSSMETVFNALQESNIERNSHLERLYTLDGKLVREPSLILQDGKYVAVEGGKLFPRHFKKRLYELEQSDASHKRMHFTKPGQSRLPPIEQGGSVSLTGGQRSPRKTYKAPVPTQKPKLVVAEPARKTKRSVEVRGSDEKRRISVLKQESFPNITLSASPPNFGDESPDFSLPSLIKVAKDSVSERISEEPTSERKDLEEIPSDIDELEETEKISIGKRLYNASGMDKEWGAMVPDDNKTRVEKLIDDIPAEEVEEEIERVDGVTLKTNESRKDDTEKTRVEKLVDDIPESRDDTEKTRELIDDIPESRDDTEKTIREHIRDAVEEGTEKVEEKQDALLSEIHDENDEKPIIDDGIEEVILASEGVDLGGDGNSQVINDKDDVNKRTPSPETRSAFEDKSRTSSPASSTNDDTRKASKDSDDVINDATSPGADTQSAEVTSPQSEEVTSPAGPESGDSSPPEDEESEEENPSREEDSTDTEGKGNNNEAKPSSNSDKVKLESQANGDIKNVENRNGTAGSDSYFS